MSGHALPEGGAVGLRQWLALIARGAETKDEAEKWAEPELARINALSDAVERWYQLRRFADFPFTRSLGAPWNQRVTTAIAELQKNPAIVAEMALLAELDAITVHETQDMKVTTLEAVGPRYEALAARAPNTVAGKLAARDAERIKQLWKTVPGKQ